MVMCSIPFIVNGNDVVISKQEVSAITLKYSLWLPASFLPHDSAKLVFGWAARLKHRPDELPQTTPRSFLPALLGMERDGQSSVTRRHFHEAPLQLGDIERDL
ncbi:hypothetical protein ACJO10_12890 [Vibrio parahaemolyticus]|uniref:hypothetical protein n=1 Tax=Vibrio parahaemolyticus TaxID=670 RepID=UPI00387ACCFF